MYFELENGTLQQHFGYLSQEKTAVSAGSAGTAFWRSKSSRTLFRRVPAQFTGYQ